MKCPLLSVVASLLSSPECGGNSDNCWRLVAAGVSTYRLAHYAAAAAAFRDCGTSETPHTHKHSNGLWRVGLVMGSGGM